MDNQIKNKFDQFQVEVRKKKMKDLIANKRKQFFEQELKLKNDNIVETIKQSDYFKKKEELIDQLQSSKEKFAVYAGIFKDLKELDPNNDDHLDVVNKIFDTNLVYILVNEISLIMYTNEELVLSGLKFIKLVSATNLEKGIEQLNEVGLIELFQNLFGLNGHQQDTVNQEIISALSNLLSEERGFRILAENIDIWTSINQVIYYLKTSLQSFHILSHFYKNFLHKARLTEVNLIEENFLIFLNAVLKSLEIDEQISLNVIQSISLYLDQKTSRTMRLYKLEQIDFASQISFFLSYQNKQIQKLVFIVIAIYSSGESSLIKKFYSDEIVRKLIDSLQSTDKRLRKAALDTIYNLIVDDVKYLIDLQREELIDYLVYLLINEPSLWIVQYVIDLIKVIFLVSKNNNQSKIINDLFDKYDIIHNLLFSLNRTHTEYLFKVVDLLREFLHYGQSFQISGVNQIAQQMKNSENIHLLYELQQSNDDKLYEEVKGMIEEFLDN